MNTCREVCPVFSGQCIPDECDIFKKQYFDLFDENTILKDRIYTLNLQNKELKKELGFKRWVRMTLLKMYKNNFGIKRFFIMHYWKIKVNKK